AAPPVFHLPPATLGHTRHFMPLRDPHAGDRTKVQGAFVALDPQAEVLVAWPGVSLASEQSRALSLVLARLGYLGRGESGRAACVADQGATEPNCVPLLEGAGPTESEAVRVLAAHPETWKEWSLGRGARRPDPPWNLLAETADLHAARWSDPPGSRW